MQVSVENTSSLGRKLTLKIPADKLDEQVDSRIREMQRTVRLKGFRPGRVPPQVIRQRFGQQVRGEALSELINENLRTAFEEQDLQPAAQPSIDTTGEAVDGEIACTATFDVMPELPDVDIAGLEIERPDAEVTEADIDNMLQTLQQQRRHFHPVDRAAQRGDQVEFEFAATVGDYRYPETERQSATAVLDGSTLFAALEDALVDHVAGDEFEQAIEFPEEFGHEQLAGRNADVELKVVAVKEVHLPEIDGDFIQQFGVEGGDMDVFRNEIRANLERELHSALRTRLKNEVSEKLAGQYPDLEVPQSMVDNEARAMLQARMPEGKEVPQEALQAAEPAARTHVAAALLMGEIARKQEIQVDRERVGDMLASIASTYEEPEQVIQTYQGDSQRMAGLQNRVLEDQVAEWVADNANTTDQKLDFDDIMNPNPG